MREAQRNKRTEISGTGVSGVEMVRVPAKPSRSKSVDGKAPSENQRFTH